MTMLKMLKFMDSSKTRKSKYLENDTSFLFKSRYSFIIQYELKRDKKCFLVGQSFKDVY